MRRTENFQVGHDDRFLRPQNGEVLKTCSSPQTFCRTYLCLKLYVRFSGSFRKHSCYSGVAESLIDANTLRLLLVSLALSDLAAGLFAQPMFGVIIAVMLNMTASENF